jgi:hypothetical protein
MAVTKRTRLATSLSGAAGAYFVAGELSRRGYIATLTIRNARGIDLLVANKSATRSASIQVKTNQDSHKAWLLDAKAEEVSTDNLFYVFVNLNGTNPPAYHVVDANTIAKYCFTKHREWLKGTKRDGSPRKDTSMREFKDAECAYLDAWHLLGLDQ